MHLTVKEAKKLGIWQRVPKSTQKQIIIETKKQKGNINPQLDLYNALIKVLPEAQWEVENLIPNRKFRADIYLPSSRIYVEVDAFVNHARAKSGFHATLDRQNIFTVHGYHVLRYYTGQIQKDLSGVIAQIVTAHERYKTLDFF
jgi:very-short-patch-repair endonuclease